MDASRLATYLTRAPRTPGVYVWRDAGRRPLYIGKATNLRSRLSNYKRPTDPRIAAMVVAAHTLTWKTTDTDIEALIVESQLIKRLKPHYNIDWRDDKNYFYVAITDEVFPQVILTHQHQNAKIKKPIKEFIGPFTDGVPLKATLRVLRNIFPYCTCKQKHHLRCLNAHIGKCPGYCCLKEPAENYKLQIVNYQKNIRAIRDVLTGRPASPAGGRDALMRRLVHTMPDVAMKLLRVFHNAQVIQNLKLKIENSSPNRVEGYDIANIQGQHAVGAMVVFTAGTPDKAAYRLFNIHTTGGDTDMLREMLERRVKHAPPAGGWPLPDLVVVDGGKAQLNVALATFKSKAKGRKRKIVALTKDARHHGTKLLSKERGVFRERSLVNLSPQERTLVVHVNAEAHRFAIQHYRRKHQKTMH